MSLGLAERQLQLIAWNDLRAGGVNGGEVAADVRIMLFDDSPDAGGAYMRLENPVVAQGNLFECAPAVVSVIMAAVAEGSIPEKNLAMVLDLLGRILGGSSDPSEVRAGRGNLQERCQAEALKGYWSLVVVALNQDLYEADAVARDVLEVLDEGHALRFLET